MYFIADSLKLEEALISDLKTDWIKLKINWS